MFAKWTKDAIEFAGISQAELARRLTSEFNISVDRAAVNKATLGKRDLSADELLAISTITRFPIPEFDELPPPEVNIVGKVMAGSDAVMFSQGQGPFGTIRAPEWAVSTTVAVEVQGDSLGNLLDGSHLFYNEIRTPPDPNWIGKICVCGLGDGRIVVKALRNGRLPGRWDLHANIGPPIYDAEIEWAAVVKEIRPR
jgi:transcriptional regulator with XRE-family HTH domain